MSGAHERHLHCVVLVYPKPTHDGECGGGWGLSYRLLTTFSPPSHHLLTTFFTSSEFAKKPKNQKTKTRVVKIFTRNDVSYDKRIKPSSGSQHFSPHKKQKRPPPPQRSFCDGAPHHPREHQLLGHGPRHVPPRVLGYGRSARRRARGGVEANEGVQVVASRDIGLACVTSRVGGVWRSGFA